MLRVRSILLIAAILSAVIHAADYDHSISFTTGTREETDFKYSKRWGGFELGVNPGIFSVIKSGLFWTWPKGCDGEPSVRTWQAGGGVALFLHT